MRLIVEILIIPPQSKPRSMVSSSRRRLEISKRRSWIVFHKLRKRAGSFERRAQIHRLGDIRRCCLTSRWFRYIRQLEDDGDRRSSELVELGIVERDGTDGDVIRLDVLIAIDEEDNVFRPGKTESD